MSILFRARTLVAAVVVSLQLSFGSTAGAADIQWRRDYGQALEESAKSGKPLLVQVSADWCGFCQKMKAETLRDAHLIRHVNDCFIPLWLDADKDERLVKQFKVEALPATVIVSPKRLIEQRLVGFQNVLQFDTAITKVCAHEHGKVEARFHRLVGA
jgi:thioredoxin-like negative regulator of GroEL